MDKLDHILSSRAVPLAPLHLTARIIAASGSLPPDLWQSLRAVFLLPRPAFAMAVFLLIGFFCGAGVAGVYVATAMADPAELFLIDVNEDWI